VGQSALDHLARRCGIALTHRGIDGTPFRISKSTKQHVLAALGVKVGTAVEIAESRRKVEKQQPPELKAARGKRCFLPEWLQNGRAWGITVQLYELRSQRNWGIGDFVDLAAFCVIAARAEADFVGTNPLHALFLAEPKRCSPFSPSSRLFLNPLYIAVDKAPGYSDAVAEPHLIRQLVDAPLVDYEGVAAVKLRVLRRIWEARKKGQRGKSGKATDGFEAFCKKGGEALRLHALFDALSFHMVEVGRGAGWTAWPAGRREHLPAELQDRARLVETEGWQEECSDLPLAHMGRGPDADALFFDVAFAAGRLAGSERT
jgi:4-alpha-glucanotransferase